MEFVIRRPIQPNGSEEEERTSDEVNVSDAAATIPHELRMKARLDYQLQPEKSIVLLILSHFAYWQNLDLLAFVLNVLYPKQKEPSLGWGSPANDG